ncbi:transcriptional regulator [Rhodobacteraceae bacterium WD3A24]|nr:transcriptional regulator [Rhodobacteraceae bacterium WD3A24]
MAVELNHQHATEYELHKRLGYRVSRLSRILQNKLESLIAEHGLTRLMWCVLTGVGEEGVNTPSALADYIGVTRPAASRLLRSLEARGYLVRRNGNGPDGRAVRVELTEQGAAVTRATRARVDALNEHFRAKLAPEHFEAVMSGLALLAEGEDEGLTDF